MQEELLLLRRRAFLDHHAIQVGLGQGSHVVTGNRHRSSLPANMAYKFFAKRNYRSLGGAPRDC